MRTPRTRSRLRGFTLIEILIVVVIMGVISAAILLSVNLTGYLLCAQAFGKAMIERGRGALVHTASIAGSNAQGFSGAYSVSKAGVLMLSRQLAVEWGRAAGGVWGAEPVANNFTETGTPARASM